MVLDISFLREILKAFQSSNNAFMNIPEVQEHGLDHNSDQFLFHMNLLGDMQLVETDKGKKGIAYYRRKEGSITWYGTLRLTAAGDHLAVALNNESIWTAVKERLQDHSMIGLLELVNLLSATHTRERVNDLRNDKEPRGSNSHS